MARAAGKKASKPAVTATAATNSNNDTSKQTATTPSDTYRPIPTSLRPLVATLPTNHIYTVHIDRTSPALKKQVYTIPILMNLAISMILAWRIYYAAPVYLQLIITIFGFDTSLAKSPTGSSSSSSKTTRQGLSEVVSTISERTFLLMFDYAIFALLGSWPWEFVFGSKYTRRTGAVAWRWQLGFSRQSEVVVRQARKWDQELVKELDEEGKEIDRETKWSIEEEVGLQYKVEKALRRSYTAKTGYLLLDKEWDLDFRAMIDANHLLDRGTLKANDVDHVVLLYWRKQWFAWYVSDAAADTQAKAEMVDEDVGLKRFRDGLTARGAEDVFFRWIEIVQYESSVPGGFTASKKRESLDELRSLLKKRGVDADEFLGSIGGEKAVPGLS